MNELELGQFLQDNALGLAAFIVALIFPFIAESLFNLIDKLFR